MKLSEPLHLSREHLTELDKLAAIAASAISIDEVYEFVSDALNKLVPNDGLILNLVDIDRSEFSIALRTGLTPNERRPGQTHALDGSMVAAVVESQQPIQVTATTLEEATGNYPGLVHAFNSGYRSWLAVPLYAMGEIIGGLHVQRLTPVGFTDQEVDTLQRVATYVGATTGKHQMIVAREAETQRHQTLVEISMALARTNDLQRAVEEIARLLSKIMPVDRFVVSFWSEESESMIDVALWGTPIPGWDDLRNKPSRVLSPDHFDLSKPVMIVPTEQIASADIESQPGLAYAAKAGLNSMIVASMIEEEKRTGNISARTKVCDAYSADHAEFFQQVGLQFSHYVGEQIARQKESEATREREQAIAERKVALSELQFERARERIIDTISHELRTPLTVIMARADILRMRLSDQDEKTLKGLDSISNASMDLKGLINQLIDHAERNVSASDKDFQVISVNSLTESLVSEINKQFATKDITLNSFVPSEVDVRCDLTQTIKAIAELVDNSVKYGPEGSPVAVDVGGNSSEISISVTDQGSDLSPETVSSLFEPYERGDNMGQNIARGAGLGLHYARAVAEIQGGVVYFKNNDSGHSVFTFTLPVSA